MYCTYLTHILLRMDVLVALIDSSRGGEGRYPVRHYLAYMYLLADEDDAAIEPRDVDIWRGRESEQRILQIAKYLPQQNTRISRTPDSGQLER